MKPTWTDMHVTCWKLIRLQQIYSTLQLHYDRYALHHRGWISHYDDLTYSSSQWDQEVLDVYVVPFSHQDPGWKSSMEKLFREKTRKTIDYMVEFLTSDPNMTFVWSEIIFLEKWYSQADAEQQNKLKKLLSRGQLELLTGGWVMTDEAVTHYYAMLDQLIEGHQWLYNVLNYTASTAWSLDSFGVSPTMTYILQGSGISNLLVQRIHYNLKRALADRKQLQFLWRQTWGVAWVLLDQLRKKAQFFSHDKLLMLYGDDFRFFERKDWQSLNNNLKQLITYMNSERSMHIKLRFSTLSEYFKSVKSTLTSHQLSVPSLSGDFFTYNDRDDQSAEILFTLLSSQVNNENYQKLRHLTSRLWMELEEGRRVLGLSQHHDAITGTSAAHTMMDYFTKVHRAVFKVDYVAAASISFLLQYKVNLDAALNADLCDTLDIQMDVDKPIITRILDNSLSILVVFNPLPLEREEFITVTVLSPFVMVEDMKQNPIGCQVAPMWADWLEMEKYQYKELDMSQPKIMVTFGPLVNEVYTILPLVTHRVTIYNTEGSKGAAVHIKNIVNLEAYTNTELAMRISTNINNERTFYTDNNGFQMQKRTYLQKYKIQGNYYPIATQIFIEDDLYRATVHTAYSHGASSLSSGAMEVMLDRRLNQDDWRGLGAGITDNVVTPSQFILLIETNRRVISLQHTKESGVPSLLSHQMSLRLNTPPELFIQQKTSTHVILPHEPLTTSWPCDIQLVNLRSLSIADNEAWHSLLIVHRLAYSCIYMGVYEQCRTSNGPIPLSRLFSSLKIQKAWKTSLTGLSSGPQLEVTSVELEPMEIKTYKIRLSWIL
ncbi:hypothetical protein LSH36_136g04043 [Paralvinella palmiformis]|uniref:Alpha-mannosidase n=1 Tax=Paralvinella palmiformis TaxID=53620 RepID=A0AAD9N7T1_9ANNE|nr:hypothetical protein LSH36_136g04043 [Paralvinella palmiformis]